MSCPHCAGAGRLFGRRVARRDLRRFRSRGAKRSTRMLIAALVDRGVTGAEVLDVGAGVGEVHLALLEAGARSAVGVDSSRAYQDAALEEAEQRGLAGRVRHVPGDYVDRSEELGAFDVVTLDRVVCCYPDMPALVDAAARHSRGLVGLVLPVDAWWTRLLVAVPNLGLRILRNPFRIYVHAHTRLEEVAGRRGFRTVHRSRAGMWQVLVLEALRSGDRVTGKEPGSFPSMNPG